MGSVGKGATSSGLPLRWVEFEEGAIDQNGDWTESNASRDEIFESQKEFAQMLIDTGAFGSEQISADEAAKAMDYRYYHQMSYDFDSNNDKLPKTPAVGLSRWKAGAWAKGYGSDRQSFDKMYGISNYIDSNPSIQLNTDNNLYRGVKSTSAGLQALRNAFANGDMISMNGPSSWTSMKGMAEQFTHTSLVEPDNYHRVVFIDTTKGRRNAIPYPFSMQAEVVASGSAKYKVVDIEDKGGVTYVKVKQ